jgi:hypothetical protein
MEEFCRYAARLSLATHMLQRCWLDWAVERQMRKGERKIEMCARCKASNADLNKKSIERVAHDPMEAFLYWGIWPHHAVTKLHVRKDEVCILY